MENQFESTLKYIKKVHAAIENRVDMRCFRLECLEDIGSPIVKNAFDSRRINQDTDYNPRRNLQYYHRSDEFVSKDASAKIKNLFKLKNVMDDLKDDFLGEPEWHDSYCRVLSAALDRTLRIDQKDMDFFTPQLDYINELMYLRYRLNNDDLISKNEKELREIILNKDEKLMHKQIYANYNRKEIIKETNVKDNLMEKLFGEVKASSENPNVKRSVNITIEDSIVKG